MVPVEFRICATCTYCNKSNSYYKGGVSAGRGCYECTNKRSDYYLSYLNVSDEGVRHTHVIWIGCDKWKPHGVKKEVKERLDSISFVAYNKYVKSKGGIMALIKATLKVPDGKLCNPRYAKRCSMLSYSNTHCRLFNERIKISWDNEPGVLAIKCPQCDMAEVKK